MDKEAITKELLAYLTKELEVPEGSIKSDVSLEELAAIGMNSVYFIKVIIDLETIFGIDFDDSQLAWEEYQSLQDLVDYIFTKQS